ncbi:hypothetical protein AB0F88_40210 [Streptosporangium sp. NPDC023963]|uniref:hypothetical protein n=1 Tax=Streptosporangium sp. NPDC023963 TaxID=3155608 RepID=UPI0034438325
MTTWAPRWLEEDYAWAAAYLRWQAGQCPACRLQLSDTTAMRDGEPVHSYKVPPPRRCQACDELIKVQHAHSKKGSVREGALLWHIEQTS